MTMGPPKEVVASTPCATIRFIGEIAFDWPLRRDVVTRMQAHDIALKNGLETNDEGRALEERPPLTSEQINQWQNLYGPRAGQAPTTATTG